MKVLSTARTALGQRRTMAAMALMSQICSRGLVGVSIHTSFSSKHTKKTKTVSPLYSGAWQPRPCWDRWRPRNRTADPGVLRYDGTCGWFLAFSLFECRKKYTSVEIIHGDDMVARYKHLQDSHGAGETRSPRKCWFIIGSKKSKQSLPYFPLEIAANCSSSALRVGLPPREYSNSCTLHALSCCLKLTLYLPGASCLKVVDKLIGATTAFPGKFSGSWPAWMASVPKDGKGSRCAMFAQIATKLNISQTLAHQLHCFCTSCLQFMRRCLTCCQCKLLHIKKNVARAVALTLTA